MAYQKHLIALATFLLWSLAAVRPAFADCAAPRDDVERAQCVGVELRDSDRRINTSYQNLMAKLDDAGKTDLRRAQRAWLKQRTVDCALDTKETDREKWLQKILLDYQQTVCVVRFTNQREMELTRALAAQEPGPKSAGQTPSAPLPETPTNPPVRVPSQSAEERAFLDYYDRRSGSRHDKGKWYFEVQVTIGEIAKRSDTTLYIGASSPTGNTGTIVNARRMNQNEPSHNFGIAIDLDNGKLYTRRDGTWLGGLPGSNQGFDLKLGRPYAATISASVSLRDLEEAKLVSANFGINSFTYSLPDGYLAFDAH